MKSEKELKPIIKCLSGITYNDWVKIKAVVDNCFDIKQQEFKRTLELPTEEIDNVIRQQFG